MINPPCDDWEDRIKPSFIENTIREICENIAKKGENGSFPEIFTHLYEYIEENLEKYAP